MLQPTAANAGEAKRRENSAQCVGLVRGASSIRASPRMRKTQSAHATAETPCWHECPAPSVASLYARCADAIDGRLFAPSPGACVPDMSRTPWERRPLSGHHSEALTSVAVRGRWSRPREPRCAYLCELASAPRHPFFTKAASAGAVTARPLPRAGSYVMTSCRRPIARWFRPFCT